MSAFPCKAEIVGTLDGHFLGESLLTCFSSAQPVGHFFVNFPPVADDKNPDHSGFAIQFVNNAKPPDFDSPHAGRMGSRLYF